MSAAEAGAAPAAPPPGWTTSEFWSRALVDGIGVLAMLLTLFTGSDDGIEGAEAVVPAAAVLASAIAHAAYAHARVRVKVAHIAAKGAAAERALQRVEPLLARLAPVAEAADPALARRVAAAEAAGREATEEPR